MTTGASAEPRTGCPSCFPEDPCPPAFCSDESVFFDSCRSADDGEDPPLPAPHPIKIVAVSAARMRSANAPRADLRESVLIPISPLPPSFVPYPQLYSLFGARPQHSELI